MQNMTGWDRPIHPSHATRGRMRAREGGPNAPCLWSCLPDATAGVSSRPRVLEIQTALIERPEAGPVIPGSGGVRKLRWRAPGRGKRGGYRVIYYAKTAHRVIWMLTMYPKNVADNIPAHVLRQIRKEVEDG